jgi:hypothetical protein
MARLEEKRKKVKPAPEPIPVGKIEETCEAFQVVSHFKDGFGFMTPELDDDGNKVFSLDANGNSKVQKFKMWEFSKVHVMDPETGKVSSKLGYCVFVASKEKHGRYFEPIVKELNRLMKDPSNKLFTMDGHFQKRNPEAFRIKEQLKEKDSEIDKLKQRQTELLKKLGLPPE